MLGRNLAGIKITADPHVETTCLLPERRLWKNLRQVLASPLAGPAQAETENVTRLGSKEFSDQANGCYP